MNNIQNWDYKFVEDLLSTFKPTIPKDKKYIPCRIKINGEFIQTCSGKSLWKCRAHAKSALNNHWKYSFDRKLSEVYPYLAKPGKYGTYIDRKIKDECYKEFLDFLQKQGILEFVDVT